MEAPIIVSSMYNETKRLAILGVTMRILHCS